MKKTIITNSCDIQLYIKDIRKLPVISHERQDEIFDRLTSKNITEEEKKKLNDELILGNLRFVISIAKQYQNQGMDIMDLISEGNIGLMKAAERFDPNSGWVFISYAVWWVRQSIMSALNEYARTIRVPSNIIQEHRKSRKKEGVGDTPEDPHGYNLPHCINLGSPINDEGDTFLDLIPNKNAGNPEDIINSPEEVKKRVKQLLSILDDRERVIIEKSFGIYGQESNLEELGEEFKCTKERIRQIRDKSMKKLRNESFELFKYL